MTAARKAPKRATVRYLNDTSTEFDGAGVVAAFKTLEIRYMRSRFGGGWLVPTSQAQDVLALLEVRGYRVDALL